MADRAGSESNADVPKEVFELDKDERWQARLDEARARREIALREKAAGKPQKPRPKPWEVEGAQVEEPREIDPVIQERGDDKFDFADRLETIREAQGEADQTSEEAEFAKAFSGSESAAAAPEPRARPQPSLILPGAPDVAELASRYAATLHVPEDELEDAEPFEDGETLVAMPGVEKQEAPAPRPMTRAERRRGIRPLGMAVSLLALAALPLSTEAPPLEVGPEMPLLQPFRVQPALGVTWSLNVTPTATDASDWSAPGAPTPLAPAPFERSVNVGSQLAGLPLPASPSSLGFDWAAITAFETPVRPELLVPGAASSIAPNVAVAPVPPLAPVTGTVSTSLPQADAPAVPLPAPARPVFNDQNRFDVIPVPVERGASLTPVNPLRVTILAPSRADRALADEIATNVRSDGHELVRIRDVEYAISARNIRFFHEADRASATAMAERYDAELRDFTWFRPKPAEGTTELWLSGRASGAQRPQPDNNDNFLGNVLNRLGLGTELPRRLPNVNEVIRNLPAEN